MVNLGLTRVDDALAAKHTVGFVFIIFVCVSAVWWCLKDTDSNVNFVVLCKVLEN